MWSGRHQVVCTSSCTHSHYIRNACCHIKCVCMTSFHMHMLTCTYIYRTHPMARRSSHSNVACWHPQGGCPSARTKRKRRHGTTCKNGTHHAQTGHTRTAHTTASLHPFHSDSTKFWKVVYFRPLFLSRIGTQYLFNLYNILVLQKPHSRIGEIYKKDSVGGKCSLRDYFSTSCGSILYLHQTLGLQLIYARCSKIEKDFCKSCSASSSLLSTKIATRQKVGFIVF